LSLPQAEAVLRSRGEAWARSESRRTGGIEAMIASVGFYIISSSFFRGLFLVFHLQFSCEYCWVVGIS
jgi:hypothetical protein